MEKVYKTSCLSKEILRRYLISLFERPETSFISAIGVHPTLKRGIGGALPPTEICGKVPKLPSEASHA